MTSFSVDTSQPLVAPECPAFIAYGWEEPEEKGNVTDELHFRLGMVSTNLEPVLAFVSEQAKAGKLFTITKTAGGVPFPWD